ncbi:M48 family metallopeptidase [Telluria aromaticivorans]|uniref:M48 family metallopeptidase n=1 Tax=Telluria aromaticivorans TaxID=2725995 RepID=A0A7Y2K132_9BURK|nr:M48 family metallopeptidase [Telluria aromaticivorans]NNG24675.1 M48 family metallopeptidase [Telluria aromaticivorans]
MKKFKQLAVCVSLFAAIGGVGAQDKTVVQDGISVTPLSRSRVLIPEAQLNEAAAQQYTQMMGEAQQKGALVPASHPEVRRLRAIAQRIIPHAPRWNQNASQWKWQVNLIDSKDVNAFCMPGGRIGFFSGILTQLKLTDDEVAAVMGHEIAHALREHSREKMAKQGMTSMGARVGGALISGIFGVDPGITGAVANQAGQLLVLKFSRNEEREADLVGLDISSRAGYDPRAGITLWRKMAALSKRAPIELLSTHPGGETRIKDMEEHMNVLLPLYARAKGTTAAKLPPYRTNVSLR